MSNPSSFCFTVKSLIQILTLKTKDGHTINIAKEVTAKHDDAWEVLAYALGFTPAAVAQIDETVKKNSLRACTEMLKQWVEGAEGTKQPASWHKLVATLREINTNTLAGEVESSMTL